MITHQQVTIILPAHNEAAALAAVLDRIKVLLPTAEIIVVDDGSTDGTAAIAAAHGARVLRHPYLLGNGAAIKTGVRVAESDIIVLMDADGQHDPADIPRLLEKMEKDYEMVVGARQWNTHASRARRWANRFYNRLASWMTGYRIEDLTSGFRAVRARHFRKFLYLLPNGFSYPTTITMAFFRSGFPIAYVPIRAMPRKGKSNIRPIKDGLQFIIIILKIGALFSPMRFFLPISVVLFALGLGHYAYTYILTGRFTNMGALLFISSLFNFLIGILSEQISSLHYKGVEEDQRRTKRG